MHLKQLLSLAAISGVASDHGDLPQHASAFDGRHLQGFPASVTCILGGKSIDECCPSGATAEDGVCTLLFCVDVANFSVKDSCKCGMFNSACEQLQVAYAVVPGMEAMCGQVGTCCDGDSTTNCDFNACVGAAIADGDVALPDLSVFGSILGDLSSGNSTEAAPAEPCPAVEAPAATATTTAATTAAPATTAATAATDEAEDAGATPDGADAPSDAAKHAARAWAPLLVVFFAAVLG